MEPNVNGIIGLMCLFLDDFVIQDVLLKEDSQQTLGDSLYLCVCATRLNGRETRSAMGRDMAIPKSV